MNENKILAAILTVGIILRGKPLSEKPNQSQQQIIFGEYKSMLEILNAQSK